MPPRRENIPVLFEMLRFFDGIKKQFNGTLGNPLRLTFEKLFIDNIDAISGYKGLDILDCLRH